ncbi:nucleoside triphosphate pyrophosphohydrolase [Vacuolonema iberomarrocanum]|uniref:nucleoside triphosphate pyrophosphohydrolase n=1 Tax=Vacuolonema iberomarrocanum TaxID=3454632 RepID=UPI003F6DC84E
MPSTSPSPTVFHPMHQYPNKLVRDRIPEIIRAAGNTCEIEVLSDDDYKMALRDKLMEEAKEAAAAADVETMMTELADLYEVVTALMAVYKISPEAVRSKQMWRRERRGAFRKRIRLLETKRGEPPAE